MNILLIFFALPIAVIIISIALQKILKNPLLVAAIIFAIFLIVTFVVNNLNFLIAAIVFAIISFITALITCIACRILNRLERENSCCCRRREEQRCCRRREDRCCWLRRENNCCCNDDDNNNNNTNNVLTIRSIPEEDVRSYQITGSDGSSTRINVIPNSNNSGSDNTTNENSNGCCCRRRR